MMTSVYFLHPDLGIGGAERLIVDAALELQRLGKGVKIFTAHHNPSHCFHETLTCLEVRVVGNFLPRSFFGHFHTTFSLLRFSFCCLSAVLCGYAEKVDVIFIDQISFVVILMRIFFPRSRIYFYCHFPDLLLSLRNSSLKFLYRLPLDVLEKASTMMALEVITNSRFTRNVLLLSFPELLKASSRISVLHPSVNARNIKILAQQFDSIAALSENRYILSINRFERKKRIDVAIRSFAMAIESLPMTYTSSMRLIIAGGFDSCNAENMHYLQYLKGVALSCGVESRTHFILSCSDSQRWNLVLNCVAVFYTPVNEHFGIVPIETMAAGCPLIACGNGGPLETVLHNNNGYLVHECSAEAFARIIEAIIKTSDGCRSWNKKFSRKRSRHIFSREIFKDQLQNILS